MSKNDWTNDLREHLADYQAPVEEDVLWASIQQSLAQQQKKSRLISIRRWSVAAAACAILGIGGACLYFYPDGTVVPSSHIASEPGVKPFAAHLSEADDSSHKGVDAENHAGSSSVAPATGLALQHLKSAVWTDIEQVVAAHKDSLVAVATTTTTTENKTSQSQMRDVRDMIQAEGTSSLHSSRSLDMSANKEEFKRHNSKHVSSIKMKLYGENGLPISLANLGDDDFAAPGVQSTPTGNLYSDEAGNFAALLTKVPKKVEWKHKRPVSIGMQVGVGISPRLSLTTGVVYTKAESEFNTDGMVGNQTLHYVGIPLGVSYEVWGTKWLHTYVTAGGEGDVNISNQTDADGSGVADGKDRMQWSTNASVGVQVDLAPQIGIYAEPGMKYYFDNGSEIKNSFKDKKLNFNFQFGLRWNLNEK